MNTLSRMFGFMEWEALEVISAGKWLMRQQLHPDSAPKVYFIARGDHFLAIRKRGLKLNTAEKDGVICVPYRITDRPETLPEPDLCLLCVKSYDLNSALHAISSKAKDKTIIIPLLNGVDIHERVRTILKSGIVLPACAYVGTHIEEVGVVTQKGASGVILCGKDPSCQDFNPEPLIAFFNKADIKYNWVDNPFPAIWEKFIFIAAFGLVTACSEKTLGGVAADLELCGIVAKIMREIVAIARKWEYFSVLGLWKLQSPKPTIFLLRQRPPISGILKPRAGSTRGIFSEAL